MAKKTNPKPTNRDIKAAEKLIKSNVIQSIDNSNALLKQIIEEESAKYKEKAAEEMMPIRVSEKEAEDPIEKLKKSIDERKKSKSAKESAKTLKKSKFEPLDIKTTPLSDKSAQESADVFYEKGKELAEKLVNSKKIAGKTAKESASVLKKAGELPSQIEVDKKILDESLSKRLDELFSKQRLGGKTATEAADVLTPKELPVPAGEVITRKDVSDILPRETTTRTSTATPDITPEYRALKEGTDIVPTSAKSTALVPRGVKQAAKSLRSGVSNLATKGAPIVGAGLDIYDVYSALKEDDYRRAAGSAGSALGSLGLGSLGGFGGPAGAVAGSYVGSRLGGEVGSSFYDYLSDPKKRDVVLSLLASGETGFGSAAEKLGDLVQSENKASVSALKQRPDSDYKVPERPTPLLPVDEKEEEPTTLPSARDVKFEDEEEEFDTPLDTPVEEEPLESSQSDLEEKLEISDRIKPVEETKDDLDTLLKQARSGRDLSYLAAALGKAGESIGTGISGLAIGGVPTKPTGSDVFDALQKYAESKVQDVKEDYLLKQKRLETEQKADREDPTSNVSKSAQKTLLRLVPNLTEEQVSELSYNQIKELQLGRLGIQTSALQQKGELAKVAQERKVAENEKKVESAKKLGISKYYQKENETTRKSKEMDYLNQLTSATETMEKAALDPENSGINDIAGIFKFMKILDPTSAVRPSEVELTKEAMSIWAKLNVALSKYNLSDSPKVLTKEVKRQMYELVKAYNESAKKSYKKIIQSKAEVAIEAFGADPEQAYRLLDVNKLLSEEDKPLIAPKAEDQVEKPETKKVTTESGLNIYYE